MKQAEPDYIFECGHRCAKVQKKDCRIICPVHGWDCRMIGRPLTCEVHGCNVEYIAKQYRRDQVHRCDPHRYQARLRTNRRNNREAYKAKKSGKKKESKVPTRPGFRDYGHIYKSGEARPSVNPIFGIKRPGVGWECDGSWA